MRVQSASVVPSRPSKKSSSSTKGMARTRAKGQPTSALRAKQEITLRVRADACWLTGRMAKLRAKVESCMEKDEGRKARGRNRRHSALAKHWQA